MPQLYQTLKSGNGHCPTGQLPVREVVDAVYDRAIDVVDRAYLSRHARITADGFWIDRTCTTRSFSLG